MREKLAEIKSYTTDHGFKRGDRYLVRKEDVEWLVKQVDQSIIIAELTEDFKGGNISLGEFIDGLLMEM